MEFATPTFIAMFGAVARTMNQNRDALCALDGVIGDADHGIAMQQGFAAVEKALAGLDPVAASPTDVFNTAAKSFLNAVGASSGPLYATAMMRAGAALKGHATVGLTEVALLIPAMTRGIADRGKAQVGDKTMLDAWSAAAGRVQALLDQAADPASLLPAAAEAAAAGADATKAMEAKLGRAARLGQRSVGHVDPGAASAALLIRAFAESFAQT